MASSPQRDGRSRRRSRSPREDDRDVHPPRRRPSPDVDRRPTSPDRARDHRAQRRHPSDDRTLDRRHERSRSPDRRRRHRDRSHERRSDHDRPRDPSRDRHRARDHKSRHAHRRHSPSRSASPAARHHRRPHKRNRSRSRSHSRSRAPAPAQPFRRSAAPLPTQQDAFQDQSAPSSSSSALDRPPAKQKPNYAPSGKLAAETNAVAGTGVVLKYHEPPEARKPAPADAWRMYEFKGADTLETVPLWQRSCWLVGREAAVADFPVQHPSCSGQHAVLQFRFVEGKKNEFGDAVGGGVKLYVIDLESANGTRVNGERVPERRFMELRSGDVLVFGQSSREYVMMLPPKE